MATKQTAGSKLPKLPYTGFLGDSDQPDFWLRAWARDQSKVEAVKALKNKVWRKASDPLLCGLWESIRHLEKEAEISLGYLKAEGMLLMAWYGSTAFKTGVPA